MSMVEQHFSAGYPRTGGSVVSLKRRKDSRKPTEN